MVFELVTGSGGVHDGLDRSFEMCASACSFDTKGETGRVLFLAGIPLADARLLAMDLERSRPFLGRRGGSSIRGLRCASLRI